MSFLVDISLILLLPPNHLKTSITRKYPKQIDEIKVCANHKWRAHIQWRQPLKSAPLNPRYRVRATAISSFRCRLGKRRVVGKPQVPRPYLNSAAKRGGMQENPVKASPVMREAPLTTSNYRREETSLDST